MLNEEIFWWNFAVHTVYAEYVECICSFTESTGNKPVCILRIHRTNLSVDWEYSECTRTHISQEIWNQNKKYFRKFNQEPRWFVWPNHFKPKNLMQVYCIFKPFLPSLPSSLPPSFSPSFPLPLLPSISPSSSLSLTPLSLPPLHQPSSLSPTTHLFLYGLNFGGGWPWLTHSFILRPFFTLRGRNSLRVGGRGQRKRKKDFG